jgi:hypothetical protein
MSKFGFSWFVAGGWALDLFLNRETRPHSDIEIGIFRNNQMKLYRYFEKRKKYYIDNRSRIGKHIKTEWNKEYLRLPIHEICIEYDDLELEVLLNEKDEENWIYRRDEKIKLNENLAIQYSTNEIPYLSPEIVLLYKTKDLRDKDIEDIKNAAPRMSDFQKRWLIDNISSIETKERVRNLTTASTG